MRAVILNQNKTERSCHWGGGERRSDMQIAFDKLVISERVIFLCLFFFLPNIQASHFL